MTTITYLDTFRYYLEIAVLLGFSAAAIYVGAIAVLRFKMSARFSDLNRLGKLLIIISLALPALMLAVPKQSLLKPAAQVWSGVSKMSAPNDALIGLNIGDVKAAPTSEIISLVVKERVLFGVFIALLIGSLLRAGLLAFRFYRLRKFVLSLPVVKQIGSVSIRAASEVKSPFSWRLPGSAVIVLPTDFITNPQDMRIALRHEIQHHRAGDTGWVYVFEALKIMFFWNPAVYCLVSILSQVQEFACDEYLIGHRRLSPQAYGGCLIRAAQSAVHSRLILVGTTSMAGNVDGSSLKRRIEMLFRNGSTASRRTLLTVAVGTLVLMASFAYASRSAIQDRRITMEEARKHAQRAAEGSEIPIHMNELVLERLNRYIGTPGGRKYVREALQRMPSYKSMIERKTREHGLPDELVAIAMYESGFKNDAVSPPPYRAAGIWQFIPETARKYDLVVRDNIDERTHPEKETEAAMRYFKDLHGIFQDWRLALKAYNEGERRVLQLIEKHKTRDAWVLERLSTQESYLSGATAMLIIYKNPSLLD